MANSTLILYGIPLSGHVHRAQLMLNLLGLAYDDADGSAAARQTEAFLALNPLGQIPVLVDGDLVVPDSNAILVYLATRYDPARSWYPNDPVTVAAIQRWLSIAAGEIRFGPARARIIAVFKTGDDPAEALAIGRRLLPFIDRHLAGRAFLVLDHPTIADVAAYSYIAHAPEGGLSLEPYPHIRSWVERIEALPGFVPMPKSPLPG